MERKGLVRHLLGYILGISTFAVLIPLGLYKVSAAFDARLRTGLINNLTLRVTVSSLVFVIGLIFAIWSNIDLLRIGKGGPTDLFNVAVSPRTERLVVDGPYRYTRNPMVFGVLSIYFSLAIYMNSLATFLLLAAILPLTVLYLKRTEERRLYKDFGDEFLQYKKQVPMIIPLLKRTKKMH